MFFYDKKYAKPVDTVLYNLSRLPLPDDPKTRKILEAHTRVFDAIMTALRGIEKELCEE